MLRGKFACALRTWLYVNYILRFNEPWSFLQITIVQIFDCNPILIYGHN